MTQAFTLDKQIEEVERSIAERERVHPKWVDAGHLTPEEAVRQQALLGEVLKTLNGLRHYGRIVRADYTNDDHPYVLVVETPSEERFLYECAGPEGETASEEEEAGDG